MDKNNNSLDYDIIVEDALRSVVKKSLEIVKLEGFKDNHHFFISFSLTYPGVIVPSELIKLNEDNEIKIILQHQFWDLDPQENKFSVTLSFNGQKKKIVVPYDAIFSFSDPSVGFGLQFKNNISNNDSKNIEKNDLKEDALKPSKITEQKEAEIVSLESFRSKKQD